MSSDVTEIVPDSAQRDASMIDVLAISTREPSSPTDRLSKPSGGDEDNEPRTYARKRVAITYGKKKDASEDVDMDLSDGQSSASRPVLFDNRRRSYNGDISISMSSDHTDGNDDLVDRVNDDDTNSSAAGSPEKGYKFSFMDDLAALDRQFDEDPDELEIARVQQSLKRSAVADADDDAPQHSSPRARPLVASGTSSLSALTSTSSSSSFVPSTTLPKSKSKAKQSILTLGSDGDTEPDSDDPTSRPRRVIKKRRISSPTEFSSVESSPRKRTSKSPRSKPLVRLSSISPRKSSSPAADKLFDSPPIGNENGRPSSPPTSPPDDIEDVAPAIEDQKSKRRASKIKAPTKKQRLETEKEQARMMAARHVALPEPPEENRKTLTSLFSKFLQPGFRSPKSTAPPKPDLSSDPISVSLSQTPFPRSTAGVIVPASSIIDQRSSPKQTSPVKKAGSVIPALFATRVVPDASSDELPELHEVTAEVIRNSEKERRYKELQEKKKQFVLEQARRQKAKEVKVLDEDDLEIEHAVLSASTSSRHLAREDSLQIFEHTPGKARATEALRVFDLRAKVQEITSPGKQRHSDADRPPQLFRNLFKSQAKPTESQFEAAGKFDVFFGVSRASPVKKKTSAVRQSWPGSLPKRKEGPKLTHQAMMEKLKADKDEHAGNLRQAKEEDWTAKGGKSSRAMQLKGATSEQSVEEKATWFAKVAAMEVDGDEGEQWEEDGEDEDFNPDAEEGDNDEYRGSESPEPAPGATLVPDSQPQDHTSLPSSGSRASSLHPSEDDDDKENGATDKENVPPQLPASSLLTLRDEDDLFSPTKGSLLKSSAIDDDDEEENAPPPGQSSPFRSDDEDEYIPAGGLARRPAQRRLILDEDDTTPDAENDENQPPPQRKTELPAFDLDSDEELPRPKSLHFGGIAGKALFNSSAESLSLPQMPAVETIDSDVMDDGDSFSQLFAMDAEPVAFDALRRGPLEDVDLESQRLLPTQRFSTQDLRHDAAIFEEDQLARAQIEREERQKALKPKMYLNEDGFFTQTKPASQPEPAYLPSTSPPTTPTQVERIEPTLRDTTPATPGSAKPHRRLKRGLPDPDATAVDPLPVTAFDVMMQRTIIKDPAKSKDDKVKRKQIKDTFLEGEAAESDEDVVFGFGGAKEDDKEDDEEADKPLEGLVDDVQMSDNVLNEDAVLQKHAEQVAEDDAALEKYHEAATKGQFRGKKRDRGVGFGDSDSDEDDEEGRKRRRAMRKKRNVIGDTLDELESNPLTKAFHDVYASGIAPDEDDDFGPSSEQAIPQDAEMDADADEEAEGEIRDEKAKPLTVSEVRRLVKNAIANGETTNNFDPDNVDWVDPVHSTSDEEPDSLSNIREVASRRKPAIRRFTGAAMDEEARQEAIRVKNLGDPNAKIQARAENRNSSGFGASKSGSAITSHAVKTKTIPGSSDGPSFKTSKKLAKSASLLQGIKTKKNSFDS